MIDDDEFTIDLQNMLLELNHVKNQVFFEQSGSSALKTLEELAKSNRFPSYILVDINMPDMNGFDFLDKFEKTFAKAATTTKIMIITGSIKDEDRNEAFRHPLVQDYILKPLPNDFIVNLLKKEQ